MPPPAPWRRVPAAGESDSAPPLPIASQDAFPALGAAQSATATRRSRAVRAAAVGDTAAEPYPTRMQELNERASQWQRSGRSMRDIIQRGSDGPMAASPHEETTPTGCSMASFVVRDKSQRNSALGAWATMHQTPADPVRAVLHAPPRTPRVVETLDLPPEAVLCYVHDPREPQEGEHVWTSAGAVYEAVSSVVGAREGSEPALAPGALSPALAALLALVEASIASPIRLHLLCDTQAQPTPLTDLLAHTAHRPGLHSAVRAHILTGVDALADTIEAARAALPRGDEMRLAGLEARAHPHMRVSLGDSALAALALLAALDDAIARARAVRIVCAAGIHALDAPRLARVPRATLAALAHLLSGCVGACIRGALLRSCARPLAAALGRLWDANCARPRVDRICVHEFYAMVTEVAPVVDMYARWVQTDADEFGLFAAPCALSLGGKVQVLAWEGQGARARASEGAWLAERAAGRRGVLEMRVRRAELIGDSLRAVAAATVPDLHKPLSVEFVDEAAQDAGGLRKEWHLLLCDALQDESAGLVEDLSGRSEPTQAGVVWFARAPATREVLARSELLGTVLGLALFHQITVPVRFAPFLYDILLGLAQGCMPPYDLDALRTVEPALAHGLAQLLLYEESGRARLQDALPVC
ncbi:HECT-type E3 ubiquitin transferase [Malassezia sp. CBS 17886]|nr:HECT-type E3 ubiquitin transferase [Malassezia sp. CBS 17886]